MQLLDHTLKAWRLRALLSVWLYLCLLLTGGVAQASMVVEPEAMPMAVAAMPPHAMPMAMDCAPCVRCCVAPVPAVQGVSGERIEAQAPRWQIHAPSKVETARALDSGVGHLRLPVRIEFSRWLN